MRKRDESRVYFGEGALLKVDYQLLDGVHMFPSIEDTLAEVCPAYKETIASYQPDDRSAAGWDRERGSAGRWLATTGGAARMRGAIDAAAVEMRAALGASVSVLGYTLAQVKELEPGTFIDGVLKDGIVLKGAAPYEWGDLVEGTSGGSGGRSVTTTARSV